MRIFLFIFLQISIFATDFDCIMIGSSPFSLFEALYQSYSGNRVLIIEEDQIYGGAWKGINVCGIKNADLGCHQIGHDLKLKTFLEKYVGCKIVSMDNPLVPFDGTRSQNGWYFANGCYELIDHVLELIKKTDIVLLNNVRAEVAYVDTTQKIVTLQTSAGSYTTKKLIVTPMINLNIQPTHIAQNYKKWQHYHLYLLIEDPTPPRFSYHHGIVPGTSRMMNLTHFANLYGSGQQLIVIQTHGEQYFSQGQMILDHLKRNKLVDEGAHILATDTYVYESGSFYQGAIALTDAQDMIEVLQTGHIINLSNYISKWEKALTPWQCLTN